LSEEVATPAAIPAPAPVTTPSPASSPAPTPNVAPAAPEVAASPTIDWDTWNGEVSNLPDEYHTLAEGLNGWYETQHNTKLDEINELRAVYTAMLNDEEDPRIGRLTTQLEEAQAQWDADKQSHTSQQEEYKKLIDLTVKDYVDRFWADHADLRQDNEKLQQFSSLIADNGKHGGAWEGYAAASLLSLPEQAQVVAIQAKADGVTDEYALKLASAHAQLMNAETSAVAAKEEVAKEIKKVVTQPRPAAKITNGATGTSRPNMAEKTMSGAKTLDEMRNLAAARALRVHSGGKR